MPADAAWCVTACYVARTFGVRSAMPMFQALELCPQATVIAARHGQVQAGERARSAPSSQPPPPSSSPLSLDEAYLDLTDDYRTEAPPAAEALAQIATRIEREVGITVSIGLSCNKFLAKLASELEKPRGFSVIGRAEAKAFLAPLSVRKIHGVGAVTARRMEESGLKTIADLQALNEQALVARFGKFGHRLAHFAHGKDDRRVTPLPARSRASPPRPPSARTPARARSCARSRGALVRPRRRPARAQGRRRQQHRPEAQDLRFPHPDAQPAPAHPTQRADVIFESVAALIDKDADGRTFRLIGVGVADLGSAASADPTDLFSFSARRRAQ